MIRYFTDTDTEFRPEDAKKYGYELISMPYTMNNKTYYPYVTEGELNYKDYYNTLRRGVIPTTSAMNTAEYLEIFEPVFKNGDDVCYVHFSSAMSASFDFLDKAIEELKEKYPERKFYKIDTLGITIGAYIIVDEIGQMIKAGKSLEEILKFADEEIQHFACYFFVTDLKFFRRSGRVSGFASIMGNLIGIRPIIYINEKGVMTNIGKTRGNLKAINYLLEKMDEIGLDVKDHKVVLGHSDGDAQLIEQLKQELHAKYGDDLVIDEVIVNPTMGAHCGPDGIGLAFHAKNR